jgi:membrane-bound lytic murein transglycosylase D
MDYFQGRGRKYFEKWLARSGRYVPMMRQILRENGIPEELIYLSMIESGFSPNAYSRAKAVGHGNL